MIALIFGHYPFKIVDFKLKFTGFYEDFKLLIYDDYSTKIIILFIMIQWNIHEFILFGEKWINNSNTENIEMAATCTT